MTSLVKFFCVDIINYIYTEKFRQIEKAESGKMQNNRYDYLDNRYQTLALLCDNEKKTTFLAKDNVTGQIVVKKYISADCAVIYKRLKKIWNRNLVHIEHVAENGEKALVIMEYVSGQTIEEYQKEWGLFSEEKATSCLWQILEGLGEIHKYGIVHRDIQPKNLIISTDGVIKIIDLDIARLHKENRGVDTEILGTAGYAAPEQFGFTQTDKRTDIYAVGVLLNQMLTGKLPSEEIYTKGKLGGIIQRCIRMDPEKRFQNVQEILTEMASQELSFGENVRKTMEGIGRPEKKSIWPGFRSDTPWKKTIASGGYMLICFYTMMDILTCPKTPRALILQTFAIILYLWLPVLLPLDFLHWMEKTPGIRKLGRIGKKVLGVILWFVLICLGTQLEQLV